MIARIIASAPFVLAAATPADAGYYVYWRDGSVSYLSDGVIALAALIGLVVCIVVVAALIDGISSPSSVDQTGGLDLPDEIKKPDTVAHYEDMTARTRSLKRKLDADTELAKSYIEAARARAELDDIEKESNRRANGR